MTDTKKRILLVDNDDELGKTRCLVLQSHGFHAECVQGISEARSVWKPEKYDLILVDMTISPDESLTFCEELKKQDPNQLYALISAHQVLLPPSDCPDDVIETGEGPRRFVTRIKGLLDESATAAPV